MASTANAAELEAARTIVISRTFDAPRELVWDVYTGREHVGHFWGPNGFTITTHEMDVRPGGVWRFIMHTPDGTPLDNRIDYVEVVRPERLTFLYGSRENDPEAFDVTVTFTEAGGKTTLTARMVFRTKAQYDATIAMGAVELGGQTYDKLVRYVAAMA